MLKKIRNNYSQNKINSGLGIWKEKPNSGVLKQDRLFFIEFNNLHVWTKCNSRFIKHIFMQNSRNISIHIAYWWLIFYTSVTYVIFLTCSLENYPWKFMILSINSKVIKVILNTRQAGNLYIYLSWAIDHKIGVLLEISNPKYFSEGRLFMLNRNNILAFKEKETH